ncbi:MAG: hypothetical protein ACX93U_14775 [Salipiger thiooxidans]|jgi:hypothetical protein|uniref:Uncharacterized protein n=1 Tax=Salipiger thiooxidans TaxID=282683 RepID=A0A1G7CNW5_9RHOB|nr:hypothetical protein [Salipiger thiooxidans]EEX12759.1 hypothetical protein CSE45_3514 [Citreicella sp. SE45]SDE40911.1 hypothetical protein SAMN04488105_103261 [Salipiger thiooxidans]
MAVIALLMGSFLGFFGGFTAWGIFGWSAGSAVTLYFALALGLGLLPFVAAALRRGASSKALAATAPN